MKFRIKELFFIFAALASLAFGQVAQKYNGATGNRTEPAALTIPTGQSDTYAAGSTLAINGTLSGTPTGGTLNLSNTTLTLNAAAVAGSLDSDLTAIAALSTTSFGRARLTDADAAAARQNTGIESVILNGFGGFQDKLNKIALNSPSTTMVTACIFGDSLKDRVAGFVFREMQNQYGYGNASSALGLAANPEVSTGTYAGLSPTLSAGATTAAMGTDYTVWPTGGYYSVPSGENIRWGASNFATAAWAIYYLVESGGGTFELETSPDGTTWTSRGTFNAAGTKAGAVASYSATATQFIRARTTSGTVKILGYRGRSLTTARGTTVAPLGVGGLSILNAYLTPSAVMVPILTDLAPDIVSIQMDDPRADLETALPTVIGWFRAANPKCNILLIGNGPKTGAEAEMVAQNAYFRELAIANPGYGFVSGTDLLRSIAWLTTNGLAGDGTHLDDKAYAHMAGVLLGSNLLRTSQDGRLTRPYARHVSAEKSVSTRQLGIGLFEQSTPALLLLTDDSFGFDGYARINRSFEIQNSTGATSLFRFSNNDLTFPNLGFPRAYMPNMTGSLGTYAPYTTPTTGGVLYVTGNEIKWRNAATTLIYDMVLTGAGSPEGVVTASVGKLYARTDGGANTTLYVKESGTGNTGWVAK